MDKKIVRICRWLERCAKACSAGSWGSALMDVECAKAELEDARSEIWARAEAERVAPAPKRGAKAFRVALVGTAMLFALAAPLAMQSYGPVPAQVVAEENVLEWVTADEKAVLDALRKSLSEANLAWLSEMREAETDADLGLPPADEAGRGSAGRKVAARREAPPVVEAKPSSPPAVELDSILALVQIGQKALREREPTIQIQGR
ncbi:MAG: hypothetical protein GX181_05310 [Synergistaceae bacterium]|nr:hypothetical protein [Synergistaceae bacterium]